MKKTGPVAVSWIIPLYEDESSVGWITERSIFFLQTMAKPFEVILINDGSTDRTAERAGALALEHPEVRLIQHTQNWGYGATLAHGFREAMATEYIGYTDGDAQYDPMDLLEACLGASPSEAIVGFKTKRADGRWRALQSRIYNHFVRGLFSIPLRDVNCSLKWFPATALRQLTPRSQGALLDAEVSFLLSKMGISWREVPVHHYARGELTGLPPGERPRGFGARPRVILQTILEMRHWMKWAG